MADPAGKPSLLQEDPPGVGFLRWLPDYAAGDLRRDTVAGLTVAVFLIPQSMAYAQLGGLPPIYGLYASLVPLVAYAFLGTSLHLAAGIVAIDMLILHSGLEPMAPPGSERYVELAVLVALLVGGVQLLMAVTRMGFLANLLSRPVMVGFSSGAALLIALSQVPTITGIDIEGARTVPAMLWVAWRHLGEAQSAPLLMGGGGIALLLLIRKLRPLFPGALALVVLGTAGVMLLDLEGTVTVVGDVPGGFPTPALPGVGLADVGGVLPTVFTLALVQFVAVLSLGKVFGARHGYAVRPNPELVALGTANVVGALFRSTPVSGSFSRSALNEQLGARSPLSNAIAAVVVALALLFLTPLLAFIPVPVLGAIIVVAAVSLMDPEAVRFFLRAKSVDGWIAILTFAATLAAGILEGIFIGVSASLLALLYRISRPNTAILGHLPGTRSFRDVRHAPEARAVEGVLLIRIDASFSFINAAFLKDEILDQVAMGRDEDDEHGRVRAVILDASSVNDLDTTAAETLAEIVSSLERKEIPLYFGGAKEPVRKVLRRSGIGSRIGEERFFLSPHRAVMHVLEGWGSADAYLEHVPGGSAGAPVKPEGLHEFGDAEGRVGRGAGRAEGEPDGDGRTG